MQITERFQRMRAELPDGVRLVAVSKFQPVDAIKEAYECGQRLFGESRAQEMSAKYVALPKDIEWHFIGTLQTNKIKYILPFVSLIQSVDSYRLLEEINRQAAKENRTIACLLQLHIATEETKHGFTPAECKQMLTEGAWRRLKNIQLCGMMGMATFTENQEQVEGEFRALKHFFDEVKRTYFAQDAAFCELSIGMSDDYSLAIRQGSTMVRIGTKLFGDRNI